jgi:hypothetical protein
LWQENAAGAFSRFSTLLAGQRPLSLGADRQLSGWQLHLGLFGYRELKGRNSVRRAKYRVRSIGTTVLAGPLSMASSNDRHQRIDISGIVFGAVSRLAQAERSRSSTV